MPNTKTIIFDGGPLHNQFRVVNKEIIRFEVFVPSTDAMVVNALVAKQVVDKTYTRRYYKKTDTVFGDFECFVYIEEKPTENEPNKEGTETT